MRIERSARALPVVAIMVISGVARAQVNEECNNSSTCVNVSQTGTNSGSALTANCNNQKYCIQSVNNNTATSPGGGIAILGEGVFGVYGASTISSGGAGLYGVGWFGVEGYGTQNGGAGVYGSGNATNGVQGVSFSSVASGVYGENDGAGYGVAGRVVPAGAGTAVFGDNNSSASGAYAGYFHGNVYATGTITPGSSDRRLKKNIQPLEGALATLLRLRGVTFEWKDPSQFTGQTGIQRGFIAQDVEAVMPEWVGTDPNGFKTISIPGRALESLVVESIRTVNDDNARLRERTADLERRLAALEGARRPLAAGMGEGAFAAFGLLSLAGAIATRRSRSKPPTTPSPS